jgi:hypothetical protein
MRGMPFGWQLKVTNQFPRRQQVSDLQNALRLLGGLLACGTLAVGAYVAVSTIIMIIECWRPFPISDSWDFLISGREITWSWLVSQHNEHRPLLPRLVLIADYWLSAETNVVDFVVGIVMLASLSILVMRLSRAIRLGGWVGTIWTGGLILALLFWSAQWEALIWGLPFVVFVGVLLAAAATFSVLALRPPTMVTVAIVIGLEFASAYVMASGVIVPFVAVALAIWLDRPRSHVALLSVSAALVVILYLIGYHTPPQHSDPVDAPRHAGSILVYMTAYLGGPFGQAMGWLLQVNAVAAAIAAGTLGALALATLGLWLFRRRRRKDPHEAVLFALAGFLVAEALLTSLGRVRFGVEQALAPRYATHVVLFWLLLGLLAAGPAFGNRRKLAVMAFAFPALIAIAVSELHFAEIAHDFIVEQEVATPALLANVADPLLTSLDDLGRPFLHRPTLKLSHTSIFSEEWADWINTPLRDHARLVGGISCLGSFDKAVSVTDDKHPGWRALGRAWSAHRSKPLRRIVLVDDAGLIVGYGLGGLILGPAMMGRSLPGTSTLATVQDVQWIGAFTADDPSSVTAYALLDNAVEACPLGKARAIGRLMRLVLSDIRPAQLPAGGFVDSILVSSKEVIISGWGMLQSDDARVVIDTNLPVKSSALTVHPRPDVARVLGGKRLANAGIRAKLDLDESSPLPNNVLLCVWTDDPELGRHLLTNIPKPGLCRAPGR